jgi:hypothetical protein
MEDASTHLAFVLVSASAVGFLLFMRHRLKVNYPDDQSRQMQSMLGFMRGMAIFAGIVLVLVLVDLARVALFS